MIYERQALFRPEYFDKDLASRNIFLKFFEDDRYSDQLARMRADQETYLPEDILVKVDRNAMYHSLEVRVPFIDHRLVDFANKLPMSFKTGNGIGKYLLKKLLGQMLPESLINRPKHGFSVPVGDWFRNDYASQLQEQLLSPDARIGSYLNKSFVQQLFDTHQTAEKKSAQ